MSTDLQASPDLDAELAARLQRLAERRRPATAPTTADGATPPVLPRRKRRHAAARSRAGALAMSLAATGGLTFAFANADGGAPPVDSAPAGIVSAPSPATAMPPAAATATGSAPSTTTIVNGEVFTNKWGPVQVQATFSADGSLSAVDVLQTPFRDGKSVRINDRAVPALNSEALTVQSAHVDTVSGATYTSHDYERSLQSAIDAARQAGITTIA